MALLIKPQPFSTDLHRLFNSVFDDVATSGARQRWSPAMDLVEVDDHFVLKADLPGLSEDDVSIEVNDNVLTVSGERKSEHESRERGFYRVERAYGSFRRTLTLPEGVDADAISASFDRGVLEISIPKPEQRKPRKIAIGGASAQPAIEGEATEK
jgi:HSP20 family protein